MSNYSFFCRAMISILTISILACSCVFAEEKKDEKTNANAEEVRALFLKGINLCFIGGGIPQQHSTSEENTVILIDGYVPLAKDRIVTEGIQLVDSNGKKASCIGSVGVPLI